jgi:hypothetical protein
MPPMLRWALARLPISPEEAARLEREEFEAKGFVSNIERLLVAVDASPSGQFTSRLVGLLAGARRIATTVIHFDYETPGAFREGAKQAERTKAVVKQSAEDGDDTRPEELAGDPIEIATRVEQPAKRRSARRQKRVTGCCSSGASRPPKATLSTSRSRRAQSSSPGPLRSLSLAVSIGRKRRELRSKFLYLLPEPPSRGKARSWRSRWRKPRRGR